MGEPIDQEPEPDSNSEADDVDESKNTEVVTDGKLLDAGS